MSKPAHFPWIAPYLAVVDVQASLQFYQSAFGFSYRSQAEDEQGRVVHAEMDYHDSVILMGAVDCYDDGTQTPDQAHKPSPIMLYLYVEDVDHFYSSAIDQGASGVLAPQDMPWGDRVCHLQDVDGYRWAFATNFKPCPQATE